LPFLAVVLGHRSTPQPDVFFEIARLGHEKKRSQLRFPAPQRRKATLMVGSLVIGDEFKTARKHLMANMPGDAAFKNGRPKPEDVLPDETETTTLTNEAGQVPGLTV